jgi:LytS/YehU family sensor histidine kinase
VTAGREPSGGAHELFLRGETAAQWLVMLVLAGCLCGIVGLAMSGYRGAPAVTECESASMTANWKGE